MEASLTGFLRVLFILIIVYYVFKLLVRYVFPFFVKRYLSNFQKKFYESNPHLDPNQTTSKDGEVKVKRKTSDDRKGKPDNFGEYVDYEEIKD
ncbi:MAG: DUF4834 family protein [Bacteroidales bacterium]|nr:DUF4834 family protein [Bacteroidales bacterium]